MFVGAAEQMTKPVARYSAYPAIGFAGGRCSEATRSAQER